jgi:MoaA/NifB/PqqE/SkfB family radical SAM enzyme
VISQLLKWLPTLRRELRSSLAESLYIRAGIDRTLPCIVSATVTKRCNLRCPMCMDWRDERYRGQELSVDSWKRVLRELHDFLGQYRVSFIGGEPFAYRGFVDLLKHCHQHGIEHDTTTNGTLITPSIARQLVSSRPLFLNVSVDGATSATNDRSRGMPRSLARVESAIRAIAAERKRQGITFPIRIKTVVHAWNFQEVPRLLPWLDEVGADSVDFEPVRVSSPNVTEEAMLVGRDSWTQLDEVIDQLIQARRNGSPIETSEHRLRGIVQHFQGMTATPEVKTCRAGLRRFDILPNGDVRTCWKHDLIGSLEQASPLEIWTSEAGKQNRQATTQCKENCAHSCLAKIPLRSMVKRGVALLKSSSQRASQNGTPGREMEV